METKVQALEGSSKEDSKDFSDLDNNELFDKLIEDVNGWGRFQKRMWVLSLIVSITASCNHLSPLYTAYSPKHRCLSSSKYSHVFTTINFIISLLNIN